jgi:biofilm PGA synthesis N-glycosyltransferase PgaC
VTERQSDEDRFTHVNNTPVPGKVGKTDDQLLAELEYGATVEKYHAEVVVLIPAHNEAETIAMTIGCALAQTYPPSRVVVMADNCTDDTVAVARAAGAEVHETVGNTDKKGGAINQGLDLIMPTLNDEDFILGMDADGGVLENITEVALEVFEERPGLGGLSGSVRCREQHNWVETAQAIEYERGRRIMSRAGGKIHVLSGAAAFFKVGVLRHVAESRGTSLPGEKGQYMLPGNLVEDFELTLAIRELGYSVTSTKRAQMVTDLMPTIKDLEAQRMRWYRGTIETMWMYGWKPYTRFTWVSIVYNMTTSFLGPLSLLALMFAYLAVGNPPSFLALAILAPLFVLEGWLAARRLGSKRAQIMALTFFPLYAYELINLAIYWRALTHALRRKEALWDGDQDNFA